MRNSGGRMQRAAAVLVEIVVELSRGSISVPISRRRRCGVLLGTRQFTLPAARQPPGGLTEISRRRHGRLFRRLAT